MLHKIFVPLFLLAVGVEAIGGDGLEIIDDPALGTFIDITEIGTLVVLGDDGEERIDIETFLGNFIFRPGAVVVGLNGGINFGVETVRDLAPVNEKIPSDEAFGGSQAGIVYWDDIDDKEGDVFFYRPKGEPLIVQWNWGDFDGAGTTLRIQIQVFENFASTGIYAQFIYELDPPGNGAGSSATIGYQDGVSGFPDVQFSFNAEGAVGDGTVLSLLIAECHGPPCPADLDCDGTVGVSDLLSLLRSWGACEGCPADLDGNDIVGFEDLRSLLESWGPCP